MVSPIFRFTWHLYCKYKERKSRIGAISLIIVCPRNGIRNSYQNVHDCLNASRSWKPRTPSLGKGLANLLNLWPQRRLCIEDCQDYCHSADKLTKQRNCNATDTAADSWSLQDQAAFRYSEYPKLRLNTWKSGLVYTRIWKGWRIVEVRWLLLKVSKFS